MRRLWLSSLLVLGALPWVRADAPDVYAIKGARIVTVTGAEIDRGTMVMRGGVIEAVGVALEPPAEAEVIDGTGLTVYPGLIDMGRSGVVESSPAPPPTNPATRADVERWKRTQIFRPRVSAAGLYKADSPDLEKLAAAGITSVLVIPPGEGFAGQSVLIDAVAPEEPPQIGSLAQTRRGLAVRRSPVALHLSIPDRPQGETYPDSLMGMVAFVRQTLLDAQHSRAEVEHARRTKAAAPAVDPGLEALQPALAGQTPVAIEANLAREIGRALALAKEFGLDPIIVGGLEADQAAADLKAHGARVIYSLSYPERPKSLAPDADEPLRVLRERTNAPRVPSVLAASGVVFAFESSGLKEPKQFLTNAAKAVKAGLPPEAAVRALTIDAARVAGVADQIGSIEKGKIANVIVAEGDLFSPAMAIRRVFIGGRPVGPGLSRSRSNR